MNAQVNILMLGGEMLGILVFLILFFVWMGFYKSKQDKKQKLAQEKVMELTEKGHDAKLCPKCNGKGGFGEGWTNCPECGGLGYIFKLKESKEGSQSTVHEDELKECANCGATIGKLEKTYLFEGQTICGHCHGRLKNQV